MLAETVLSNLHNLRGVEVTRLSKKILRQENTNVPTPVRHRKYNDDVYTPNTTRGFDYIKYPHLNKGLAFTMEERQALGIQGLLASNVKTQEEQLAICTYSVDRYKNPLNKHLYLTELMDVNEKLFYDLICSNIEKYMPLVYTPTVGLVCEKFGLVYKRPKGLFITIHDTGRIHKILRNWPETNIRAICVTDGERILGHGDLGAYGMGIAVSKLCLYTALAGIHPSQCLPITLDVGTNNETLLEDPLYIGLRQNRVRGKEYDDFIDEFMEACACRYSRNVLIQFEDFAVGNALRLLHKYKNMYCTFNDDIQGTAGVIVGGMLAACQITKRKITDNTYLFLGAGSASVSIANLICEAMVEQGITIEEAAKRIYFFDRDGLLTSRRPGGVPAHAIWFAKDLEPSEDFAGLVKKLKPTVLVGVSAQAGAFTPVILNQMAKNCDRPEIYVLSNPMQNAECTPQEAYDNTGGRCVYASGSPFPPVQYGGKEYHTGQANNPYVFPGIGLGILSCYSYRVPDNMFLVAAKSLAKNVTQQDTDIGRIYPAVNDIRRISYAIAEDIMEEAYRLNVAGVYPKPTDFKKFVQESAYDTKYTCYTPDVYKYPDAETDIKVKSKNDMMAAFKAKTPKK